MRLPDFWRLFKRALAGWWNDNVPRLGASLAYYTLFAIAPILVIAIAIAGFFFGPEAVRGEVVVQIQGLVGRQGAEAVQTMLEGASQKRSMDIASALGVITFLIAATGAFLELQTALNTIWRVQATPTVSVVSYLKARLVSFGLVVAVGFLLLVSLVVSAALAALQKFMGSAYPGLIALWQGLNVIVSLGVVTLLFALVYKVLPDVKLRWRDVWVGALLTAILFTIGKFIIGLYLGQSSTASTYGAAGSVVVILLWVYYASQIVLLGAEFTRVFTDATAGILPTANHARPDPDAPVREAGARSGE